MTVIPEQVSVRQVHVMQDAVIAPGDVLIVVADQVVHIVKAAAPNGHAAELPEPETVGPEIVEPETVKPEIVEPIGVDQPSMLRAFEEATHHAHHGAERLRPNRADLLRLLAKYPAGLQARRIFELFELPVGSPDRTRISTMLRDCRAADLVIKREHKTGKWRNPAYVLAPGVVRE